MNNNGIRRRSSRIRTLSSTNSPNATQNTQNRSVLGNRNLNNSLIGRKRKRANDDNETESTSDEETESSSDDNVIGTTNNNNNHNTNRNNRSQFSQLQSQSQIPSQVLSRANKRRRVDHDNDKWNHSKSPLERRETRIEYTKLASSTHLNEHLIVNPLTDAFQKTLEQQDAIYERVGHANEAHIDICQTKQMTEHLIAQTKTLANEQCSISLLDYIEALHRTYGTNDKELDFSAIGTEMAPYFLSIAPIQFMNGPLQQCLQQSEEKKKVRKPVRKRKFVADAPMIEPKKVVKISKSDKTETKSRVMNLKKMLRSTCSKTAAHAVNPLNFLMHPLSYSQSVENLFDLSFVMHEGCAQMEVNQESQQPMLSFVSSSERTKRSKQYNLLNGQCILKINPFLHRTITDTYNIIESQIQRPDDDDESGSDDNDNKSASTMDTNNVETEDTNNDMDESDDNGNSSHQSASNNRRRYQNNGGRGRGRGRRRRSEHNAHDKDEAD